MVLEDTKIQALVNQGYTPQNAKQLLGDARQMCSRMDIAYTRL